MIPGVARIAAGAALALVVLAGCEGAVNDDENFIVLTFRTSLDTAGAQANGPSERPVITADGRFVAFESRATNLVPGDTNGRTDIFRKDLQTGVIVRVSVEDPTNPDVVADGDNANGNSARPRISPDGRFVVFESLADDLVLGDSNGFSDVFLRDLDTSETFRISVDTGNSNADQPSFNPGVSDDGRYVVFESSASDLVPSDFNGLTDIFVRDTLFNVTTRVSVSTGGTEANQPCINPDLSGDGLIVAFESTAANLVTGDSNGVSDVFARDWQSVTPTTERVSVEGPGNIDGNTADLDNADGPSSLPRLSNDGRYVAFLSGAFDVVPNDSNARVDVFVRDRSLSVNTRTSVSTQNTEGSQDCSAPAISTDGRWIAFQTTAPDLVGNDTNNASDIFLRDTVLLTTVRISVATYGVESAPFFDSFNPSLTGDGRLVAFNSSAPNLAPNDSNGTFDIFVRGPLY